MIRSTKHYLFSLNNNKVNVIEEFLFKYAKTTQNYIDYIWKNTFVNQNNDVIFDIKNDILFLPKYLDYQLIDNEFNLSARARSASITQAISIVNSRIKERNKLLYIISKRKEDNKPTEYYEKKLKPLTKPNINIDIFKAELSSKNIDLKKSGKHFDLFVRLKSSGLKNINIPIKFHSIDFKWMKHKNSKLLTGISLAKNYIQLRWEIPDPEIKTKGITVGADTGLKTVVTLSNDCSTPITNKHNQSLDSILDKLTRKKKGSKNYKQTQEHRTNFINWSINQLNLSNVKEIRLEEVKNIFYKHKTSRKLSGWTNAKIEYKLKTKAFELGVQVQMQPSVYKSQRCSRCGVVLKSNRKGKVYSCKYCDLKIDADLNSAKNNEEELFPIPYGLRQMKLNLKGFYWKQDNIYTLSGEEIRVPHTNNMKIDHFL